MSEDLKQATDQVDAAFQEVFGKAREQEDPGMVHQWLDQFSDEERMAILRRNMLDNAPEHVRLALEDARTTGDPGMGELSTPNIPLGGHHGFTMHIRDALGGE